MQSGCDIRKEAEKEIKRMEEVFEALQGEECEVLRLARGYFEDSKYFCVRGEYLKAFEAAVISWAYVDALLHFGKASLPEEYLKHFTVEG